MSRRGKDRNIIRIPFRELTYGTQALSGGGATITVPLNGNLTNRTNNIGDLYQLFRITELSVRLYPIALAASATAQNIAAVMCYSAEVSDTAPTTFASASAYEHRVVQGCHNVFNGTTLYQVVNYDVRPVVLRVPKRSLLMENATKWWKTKAGTAEDWEEIQGQLFLVFDSTASVTDTVSYAFDIEGVMECSCPVTGAVTPMSRVTPGGFIPGPKKLGVAANKSDAGQQDQVSLPALKCGRSCQCCDERTA